MPKRGERTFNEIGEGGQTKVFGSERDGKRSGVVIKAYETERAVGDDSAGFPVELRDELQQRYNDMVREYGRELIVRQKFLRTKDDDERYVLVQERIDIAEPGEALQLNIEDYSDEALIALERLSSHLKNMHDYYLEHGRMPDEHTPLDLSIRADNLALTKDRQLRYIDTGRDNFRIVDEDAFLEDWEQEEHIAQFYLIPMMSMDVILGRSPQEVIDDPRYVVVRKLLSDPKRSIDLDFEDVNEVHLRQALIALDATLI